MSKPISVCWEMKGGKFSGGSLDYSLHVFWAWPPESNFKFYLRLFYYCITDIKIRVNDIGQKVGVAWLPSTLPIY